jgi:copper homeostasis protein
MPPKLLEVCVDSMESALAAQEGGAQRIELCASLREGGLTPSAATIEIARKFLVIDINVMVRPRGGDFLYSDLEFLVMHRDIEIAKELGANGVVLGILTAEGNINRPRTKALVDHARPLGFTFHRAFDMVAHPQDALETLIDLGVDRVLTSGHTDGALTGWEIIAALVHQAAGRIIVMPGGGIHENNIAEIARRTGANEFHMSGRVARQSEMHYRNPHIRLGSSGDADEYTHQVTSVDRIRASLSALHHLDNPS